MGGDLGVRESRSAKGGDPWAKKRSEEQNSPNGEIADEEAGRHQGLLEFPGVRELLQYLFYATGLTSAGHSPVPSSVTVLVHLWAKEKPRPAEANQDPSSTTTWIPTTAHRVFIAEPSTYYKAAVLAYRSGVDRESLSIRNLAGWHP